MRYVELPVSSLQFPLSILIRSEHQIMGFLLKLSCKHHFYNGVPCQCPYSVILFLKAPDFLLHIPIKERKCRIEQSLPDFLDPCYVYIHHAAFPFKGAESSFTYIADSRPAARKRIVPAKATR